MAATVAVFSSELSVNISNEDMMLAIKKQAELDEFYATYDLWTGIRTAVTLSLFFLFTVTTILYKSQCKRHKHYELYPSLEDLNGRTTDYNSEYWCPTPVDGYIAELHAGGRIPSRDLLHRVYAERYTESRLSAPMPFHLQGSYLSLASNSFRASSLPGSACRLNLAGVEPREAGGSGGQKEKLLSSDHLQLVPPTVSTISQYLPYTTRDHDSANNCHTIHLGRGNHLPVPGVRLHSSGSSSDGYSMGSSVFDLTGSDVYNMSHLGIPGSSGRSKPMLQLGGMDWDCEAAEESSQMVGINLIQATPNVSPCESVHSIANLGDSTGLCVPRKKRTFSISSYDSRDFDDSCSIGSDSVFADESLYDNVSIGSHPRSRSGSVSEGRHLSAKVSTKHMKRNGVLSRRPTTPGFPLCLSPTGAATLSTRPNTFSLGLPAAVHLSTSCERLHANGSPSDMQTCSVGTSNASIPRTDSIDCPPVVTRYVVPNLRRCNSALNSTTDNEHLGGKFRRTESDATTTIQRADSAEHRTRRLSASSSSSEDITESLSFHLMVPTMSVDYPSRDTSRASSPSCSISPPGSPTLVASLGVPLSHQRSVSPSRGRMRLAGIDGRGVLKRQFSQFRPLSPRDQCPSPFGLPTSFEEEEENIIEEPRECNKGKS